MCEPCQTGAPKLRFVAKGPNGWTVEEFKCWATAPHHFTGPHYNPRNRAELQGAPTFRGWLGPMWDGDAIRYESADAYEALSV